jgi:hypothetical protein
MADAVRRMATRVCIPVIADAGCGDLHNVQRAVDASGCFFYHLAAPASGKTLTDFTVMLSPAGFAGTFPAKSVSASANPIATPPDRRSLLRSSVSLAPNGTS